MPGGRAVSKLRDCLRSFLQCSQPGGHGTSFRLSDVADVLDLVDGALDGAWAEVAELRWLVWLLEPDNLFSVAGRAGLFGLKEAI